MCGRYVLARDAEDLVRELDVDEVTWERPPEPAYNIAPTSTVTLVVDRHDGDGRRERRLGTCAWGLVPSWAKDASGAARMINARVETLADKPAFRAAYARRRCLVPADGWFEWAREEAGPGRQPYYVTPLDGSVLAFAGLYEVWSRGEERLTTCTIVTTAAQGHLTAIHPRMPYQVPRALWSAWLDRRSPAPALPEPDAASVAGLELRPVGPAVGNVRNRGRDLLEPLRPAAAPVAAVQVEDGAVQEALDLR